MYFTLKVINYKPPLKARFPKLLTPKPIDQKLEYKIPNHFFCFHKCVCHSGNSHLFAHVLCDDVATFKNIQILIQGCG